MIQNAAVFDRLSDQYQDVLKESKITVLTTL